jgi:hypothetical protein
MATWASRELDSIAAADELRIASVGPDGTLRNPVTIWVVRHGNDLYVRSGYGRTSKWFRGVQERHEGHISAGGVEKHVAFVAADHDLNDEIDAAYRKKYRRQGARYVDMMVSRKARATTIKLLPRSHSS